MNRYAVQCIDGSGRESAQLVEAFNPAEAARIAGERTGGVTGEVLEVTAPARVSAPRFLPTIPPACGKVVGAFGGILLGLALLGAVVAALYWFGAMTPEDRYGGKVVGVFVAACAVDVAFCGALLWGFYSIVVAIGHWTAWHASMVSRDSP